MVSLLPPGRWQGHELVADDLPALQRFFEANPEYFIAISGAPPRADEARQEFDDRPPAGMAYSRLWSLRCSQGADPFAGVVFGLSDFLAPQVWHIGLFVVATSLHGSGAAQALYAQLEAWMIGQGARWCRLGAVVGNVRAEHFWQRCGYVEVRQREGIAMGARVHTVRVMVKPFGDATVEGHLQRVARDRPGAP
jgi:GNAT superfamily N-acetyltransferase